MYLILGRRYTDWHIYVVRIQKYRFSKMANGTRNWQVTLKILRLTALLCNKFRRSEFIKMGCHRCWLYSQLSIDRFVYGVIYIEIKWNTDPSIAKTAWKIKTALFVRLQLTTFLMLTSKDFPMPCENLIPFSSKEFNCCGLFALQPFNWFIQCNWTVQEEAQVTDLVGALGAHLLENAASQCVHLYFLSPVCSLMWRSRLLLCLKSRLQNSQRNGIWSLCVCNKWQEHWKQYTKHGGGTYESDDSSVVTGRVSPVGHVETKGSGQQCPTVRKDSSKSIPCYPSFENDGRDNVFP